MFKEIQTTQELGLEVKEGITKKQVQELIAFSNIDPVVIQNTSDKTRFASLTEFEEWESQERRIYTLTNQEGKLMGIIWFGKKEIPRIGLPKKINPREFNTTFAIRLYESARGKGLSFEFMFKAFILDYFHWGEPYPNIWLEVSKENHPAVALYKKFGFQVVTKPDENGKILMVWHDLKWQI